MGVEHSRAQSLPVDVDDKYEEYKKTWLQLAQKFSPPRGDSTLGITTLSRAGKFIREYFSDKSQLSILEIMAGNGRASNVVFNELKDSIEIKKWTATEMQAPEQVSGDIVIITNCDGMEAVSKYGKDHNTLLLISPPPSTSEGGYGDYFAIKKWTELSNSEYIIFVGELGASDGSDGMYKYMMEHPVWKCVDRKMVFSGIDLFGGVIEKELFIFRKN